MEYILQTNNLSKKYKNKLVLNGVNMNIKKGDVYGFVGENGSGKTTIIRLITGLIRPTSGGFTLFGCDNSKSDILSARKKIGAIVETPSIYTNFSARENLVFQGELYGGSTEEKIKSVLAIVGLEELYSDNKKAGQFSLGMRQRLGIAMALMGNPEFIILDEPMNGLDPAGIVEIRELILKLNKEKGITFLISSHILTELALVANTYGIISKGKIVKEITAEEISRESQNSVVIESENVELLKSVIEKLNFEHTKETDKGMIIYGKVALNDLLKELLDNNVIITKITSNESNIEDYYLSLIGGGNNV